MSAICIRIGFFITAIVPGIGRYSKGELPMTTEDEEFKTNALKTRTFWYATQRQNARSVCLKHDYETVREDADGHTLYRKRGASDEIDVYPDGSWESRSGLRTIPGTSPAMLQHFLYNTEVYVEAWTQSMLDQVQYMGAAADR